MGINSNSTRGAMRRGAIMAGLLASAVSVPAFGQTVANPGFETGDTTGWTLNGGYWSNGWPPPQSQYSGPATIATITTTGGTDAITGAPTVFAGNYALKLNNSGGGNDINAASQIVTGYNAAKLYYAWNAVLEPSHGAEDSPSFVIKVTDTTTNTVLTNIAYSAYTAQNAPGLFRSVNGWVTTDWKVEDIDTIAGNDIKMEFVAIDCLYGGHGGYVYLDGFGNVIPTNNVGVSFDPSTGVVKGASILLPISGTPDIDTAQPFYTTTALAGGLVNPNFVGGTLQADTANAVTNAFTVQAAGGTIDTNGFNVLFSGAFSGAGGLTKIGLGSAILSAMNTVNGSVAVNGGTLNIAGILSSLDVQINSGGTLSGRGHVIAPIFVNSGGTLAPGDTIGTLSVTDRVTMRAGSTLAIDIDGRNYTTAGGSGSYDRIVVAGTAGTFIAGGTIAPRLRGITAPATNAFTPVLGDRFTVITAASNSGQFAVAQPASGLAANMRFDVLYNPTNIQLVATPNNFAVLGAASNWKLNAVRTGAALDVVRPAAGTRAGTLQSLFNGLYGMDAAGYGYAFQQLSGEVHSNAMSVIGNTVHGMNNLSLAAAGTTFGGEVCGEDDNRKGSRNEGDCMDRRFRPAVWTQLLYQQTQVQDDAVAYDFNNDQKGFIAGVHVVNRPETRIGFGGRYTENDLQSNLHNSAKADGWGLFAYASHDVGPVRLSATGGWSKAKIKTKRDLTLLTGTTTSTAAYEMSAFNAGAEARMNVPLGKGIIQPVVGITHESVSADAVSELNTDPNLALKLAKTKWDVTRSKVGADLALPLGGPLTFNASGAWRHTISGDATAARIATLGPASWVVSSPISDNDTYEFGAGIAAKLGARTVLRLDYTGFRDGGSYKADRAMLGLSHAF